MRRRILKKEVECVKLILKGGRIVLLDLNQKIDYLGGDYKRFSAGEYHVTRYSLTDILILMLDGTLYFSEDGREVAVSKGEYYLQRQGLYQSSCRPSDDAYYIYLDFRGKWSEEGIYGMPVRGNFDIEKIYRTADYLCKSAKLRNQPLVNTARAFYEILGLLFGDNRTLDDGLMTAEKIHHYISENFLGAVDVSLLAEHFSYSADYVIRIFKRAYGITPHAYLTSCRAEYAKMLLLNTDRPVGEIAEECGYAEFTSFYRAFRGCTGMSPREWRSDKRGTSKQEREKPYEQYM